ncbi:Hypothetical predicted protein [Olea europaea subsp. europaea]|uniref:Uncharacterized protein n=1 Tax=Olea europaea subsp. europaea TaxID=158383 RepID=A0A8S0TAM4_OLEEU|nr:Hypothetical predicted protein [Olea europaea subsp. europaea]
MEGKISKQLSASKENVNVNANYADEQGINSRTDSEHHSKRFSSLGALNRGSMSATEKAQDGEGSVTLREIGEEVCVVSGLVAAEEGRIVPSRYRQPSPTTVRRQASLVTARWTLWPTVVGWDQSHTSSGLFWEEEDGYYCS